MAGVWCRRVRSARQSVEAAMAMKARVIAGRGQLGQGVGCRSRRANHCRDNPTGRTGKAILCRAPHRRKCRTCWMGLWPFPGGITCRRLRPQSARFGTLAARDSNPS